MNQALISFGAEIFILANISLIYQNQMYQNLYLATLRSFDY